MVYKSVIKITGCILTGALLIANPAVTASGAPVAGVTAAASAGTETKDESATPQDTPAESAIGAGDADGTQTGADQAAPEDENTPADGDTASSDEKKEGESPAAGVFLSVAENQAASREEKTDQVSEKEAPKVESEYADIAIAQVDNYVRLRSEPSTESEVLGKLYNNSAATILETTDNGWYRITSGSVTGYVKCEYVVAGDEQLAREVSTRYAKVNTTTLFVRTEPTTESSVLTMVPLEDDLVVVDESVEGWPRVTTVEGEGYVSAEYVELFTEFVQAESKEEEEARLAKEEAERQAAAAAAEAARKKASRQEGKSSKSGSGSSGGGQSYSAPGSSNGQAVANYACQFVGNPYVYGGTSLTNGADCSGFVMSVYGAFGISLPHSSSALRGAGYEVSLSAAQPGDIVCYSGHVGIYVGNGTIVHASTPASGITYSSATYRSPICVRRIF